MITKFYLYVRGDPSVGIQHLRTEMDLQVDVDDFNREWLRVTLQKCFTEIYNDRVGVEFEDEREEFLRKEKELFG